MLRPNQALDIGRQRGWVVLDRPQVVSTGLSAYLRLARLTFNCPARRISTFDSTALFEYNFHAILKIFNERRRLVQVLDNIPTIHSDFHDCERVTWPGRPR